MSKNASIGLLILVLGLAVHPLHVFAEETHTVQQEQQERVQQNAAVGEQPAQTREQIEAAEKAVLGEEAYQKLEVGHELEENSPVLFWSIVSGVIIVVTAIVVYFVRKRKIRA